MKTASVAMLFALEVALTGMLLVTAYLANKGRIPAWTKNAAIVVFLIAPAIVYGFLRNIDSFGIICVTSVAAVTVIVTLFMLGRH